ncbi:MAG: FHA domain-containing protein [Planctomycetota bacterium]
MMKIRLNVVGGAETKSRVRVEPLPFLIGRHEECHLRLASRTVSRRHCQLEIDKEQLFIRDLASRNPTRVNGKKLDPSSAIAVWHGDQIQVGKVSFRLSLRDPKTNGQILPSDGNASEAPAEDLLTQLDTIAGMVIPDGPRFPPSGNESTPALARSDDAGDRPETATTEASAKSSGHADETHESASADATEGDTDSSGEEPENSQSATVDGFLRLPRSLRPKAADNSQEAANDALKRLFGGR